MTDNQPQNDNPPAFPSRGGMMFYVPEEVRGQLAETVAKLDSYNSGMTLRDYFAGQAVVVMLRSWDGKGSDEEVMKQWAETAYIVADEMLKARAK